MPNPGEQKTFPNGKVGVWDGQGWESQGSQNSPSAPPSVLGESPSFGTESVTKVGLPLAGALIGGKTPLGPVGSGIGAAVGTGVGDLYNLLSKPTALHEVFQSGIHPLDTMHNWDSGPSQDEAARLATVGGLTALGETIVPPVLEGIGSIASKGRSLMAGTGLGWLLGHPGIGAAVGLAGEAAPAIGRGVRWAGTPSGTAEGQAAAEQAQNELSGKFRPGQAPAIQKQYIDEARQAATRQAGGPWQDVPDYLQKKNWLGTLGNAYSGVKQAGSDAVDYLKSLIPEGPPPPAPQTESRALGVTDLTPRRSIPAVEHYYDARDMGMSGKAAVKAVADNSDEAQALESLRQAGQSARYNRSLRALESPQAMSSHAPQGLTDPAGNLIVDPSQMPLNGSPYSQVPHHSMDEPIPIRRNVPYRPTPDEVLRSSREPLAFGTNMVDTPDGSTVSQGEAALRGLSGSPHPTNGMSPDDMRALRDAAQARQDALARSDISPTSHNTPISNNEGLSHSQQLEWERYKFAHPGTTDAQLNNWLAKQTQPNPKDIIQGSLWDALKKSLDRQR